MVRRRRPPRAGAVNDLSPLRIVKQICALQAAYYFAATVLIVFTTLVAGKRFTPDLILSWHSLRGDTTVGWTLGLCWMMTSLVGYAAALLFVRPCTNRLLELSCYCSSSTGQNSYQTLQSRSISYILWLPLCTHALYLPTYSGGLFRHAAWV